MATPISDPGLSRAVEHLVTEVNAENVLAVRRALLDEANRLHGVVLRYSDAMPVESTVGGAEAMGSPGAGFWVGRCSGDPISGPAAVSFNRKIGAIVDNCKAYIDDLYRAGAHLADVARRYEITEDEIADSFRGRTSA